MRIRDSRAGRIPSRQVWSPADLLSEALAGVTMRKWRSLITVCGVAVAVAAYVASVGVTSTAQAAVNARFDALSATHLVVADTQPDSPDLAFPTGSDARVEAVPGVISAAILWQVTAQASGAVAGLGRSDLSTGAVQVVAASRDILSVVGAVGVQGRAFNAHDSTARVAILGQAAARALGIPTRAGANASVFIDGVPFTVVGTFQQVGTEPTLLNSVIVPFATAMDLWGIPGSGSQADVETRVGAASVVASELPAVVRPRDPSRLASVSSSGALAIQSQVNTDLGGLLSLVALVALGVGILSIVGTMLVAVLERTNEIGLRRALGATRSAVGTQFLAESAILGTLGGITGSCLGLISVVVLAGLHGWIPVVAAVVPLAAPAVGSATGLVAGAYPALRAARLDPIEALR